MQELEVNLEQSAKLSHLLDRLRSKVSRIPVPTDQQTPQQREATISRGVWMMGNIRRFFRVHRKALRRAGVTWQSVFGNPMARVVPRATPSDDSGRRLVRSMKHSAMGKTTSLMLGVEPPRKRSFMDKLRRVFARRGGARGQ